MSKKPPLYPHIPKSRKTVDVEDLGVSSSNPDNPFGRIKTTRTTSYPGQIDRHHLIYKGDETIGKYYSELNKLELNVQYADKLPEVLKAIGAIHGREALNKIGNNIEWVGTVISPERERYDYR